MICITPKNKLFNGTTILEVTPPIIIYLNYYLFAIITVSRSNKKLSVDVPALRIKELYQK